MHGTSPEKLKHRSSKQLFLAGDENDMDLLSCFGLAGSSLFRLSRRLLDLDNLVLQEAELSLPSCASSVFLCLVLAPLSGVPFSSPAFGAEEPKKKNLLIFQKCGTLTAQVIYRLSPCVDWILVSKELLDVKHIRWQAVLLNNKTGNHFIF